MMSPEEAGADGIQVVVPFLVVVFSHGSSCDVMLFDYGGAMMQLGAPLVVMPKGLVSLVLTTNKWSHTICSSGAYIICIFWIFWCLPCNSLYSTCILLVANKQYPTCISFPLLILPLGTPKARMLLWYHQSALQCHSVWSFYAKLSSLRTLSESFFGVVDSAGLAFYWFWLASCQSDLFGSNGWLSSCISPKGQRQWQGNQAQDSQDDELSHPFQQQSSWTCFEEEQEVCSTQTFKRRQRTKGSRKQDEWTCCQFDYFRQQNCGRYDQAIWTSKCFPNTVVISSSILLATTRIKDRLLGKKAISRIIYDHESNCERLFVRPLTLSSCIKHLVKV